MALPPNYTFGDLSQDPNAQDAIAALGAWYTGQKQQIQDNLDTALARIKSGRRDADVARDKGIRGTVRSHAARGTIRSGMEAVDEGEVEAARLRALSDLSDAETSATKGAATSLSNLDADKGIKTHDISAQAATDAYTDYINKGGGTPPPPPPEPVPGTGGGVVGVPISQTTNVDPNAGLPDTHLETAPSLVGYQSARTPVRR